MRIGTMIAVGSIIPLLVLGSCTTGHYITVPENNEGVLISKPWFGSGGYYPTTVKGPGSTFTWGTTSAIMVATSPEQHTLEINDLMSSDGVPLDFDATILLQVNDPLVLIKSYGAKWYDNNLKSEVLSYVRDAVKKHGLNETAISTTAIASIDGEVTDRLEAYLRLHKFPVTLVRFTVGKANPPDSVKDQRIATAQQEQRLQTLIKSKLAEDQRKLSETARAEADNAYRVQMGLSPEQFVQLKTLETMKDVCGDKNCTFVGTGTNILLQR
jgi:regulator of protease activity HflC (stomatin/prohibitin superfamily)